MHWVCWILATLFYVAAGDSIRDKLLSLIVVLPLASGGAYLQRRAKMLKQEKRNREADELVEKLTGRTSPHKTLLSDLVDDQQKRDAAKQNHQQ